MIFAVDARMVSARIHGLGRYAYQLVKQFSLMETEDKFFIIANNRVLEPLIKDKTNFCLNTISEKPFSFGEQSKIPDILKGIGADLYHATSIAVPACKKTATVITIPDLIPFLFPTGVGLLKKIYFDTILRKAVREADAIITYSNHTKGDVIKHLGIDEKKIQAIPLGAENICDLLEGEVTEQGKEIMEKPYIFTLTNPRPHKNLKGLISAYDKLRERVEERVFLMVGCRVNWEVMDIVGKSRYRKDIKLINYIKDEELPYLYHNAEFFVFTSFYEGFGLPVLEAMYCGVPVIASNCSSIPEMVGDAGILVDPQDEEAFASEMVRLHKDKELRSSLAEKGRKIASAFTWESCARDTYNIYKEVACTQKGNGN